MYPLTNKRLLLYIFSLRRQNPSHAPFTTTAACAQQPSASILRVIPPFSLWGLWMPQNANGGLHAPISGEEQSGAELASHLHDIFGTWQSVLKCPSVSLEELLRRNTTTVKTWGKIQSKSLILWLLDLLASRNFDALPVGWILWLLVSRLWFFLSHFINWWWMILK